MALPIVKKWLLVLTFGLVLASCKVAPSTPHPLPEDSGNADPAVVSLNGLDLPDPAPQAYRFLVVGHAYGGIEGEDREPAKALLKKIPELKQAGLSMVVSLGDMVKQSNDKDFDTLDRRLIKPLAIPVFNVPGNHDVEDRAFYEKRYGQTFYSFTYGQARLIFLDTERESCAIDQPQSEMLIKTVQSALEDPGTANILIFMHKTLFFKNDRLFELRNQNSGPNEWICYGASQFANIIDETLKPAAAKKPVYLFAGDVGAWGNLSPYYERLEDLPLTMVMTGLGDSANDSGILVTVDGSRVQLEAYSLTDQSLPALETYSPSYWIEKAEGN